MQILIEKLGLGGGAGTVALWLGLSFVILVIIVFFSSWLVRSLRPSLNMGGQGRAGRPQRLAITDAFNLDKDGRKLVLIRRDNVEHLVLIGGTNDVLIESNIIRGEKAIQNRTNRAVDDGYSFPQESATLSPDLARGSDVTLRPTAPTINEASSPNENAPRIPVIANLEALIHNSQNARKNQNTNVEKSQNQGKSIDPHVTPEREFVSPQTLNQSADLSLAQSSNSVAANAVFTPMQQVQEGKLQEGKLQEGKLQEGKLQEGKLQEGKLPQAKPQLEHTPFGAENTSTQNQGDPSYKIRSDRPPSQNPPAAQTYSPTQPPKPTRNLGKATVASTFEDEFEKVLSGMNAPQEVKNKIPEHNAFAKASLQAAINNGQASRNQVPSQPGNTSPKSPQSAVIPQQHASHSASPPVRSPNPSAAPTAVSRNEPASEMARRLNEVLQRPISAAKPNGDSLAPQANAFSKAQGSVPAPPAESEMDLLEEEMARLLGRVVPPAIKPTGRL